MKNKKTKTKLADNKLATRSVVLSSGGLPIPGNKKNYFGIIEFEFQTERELRCQNNFNKKAQLGNMTMILAFFFLLLVIGGGIVAGVYMFFGSGYDFRQVDADILNSKMETCFKEKQIDFALKGEEFAKQLWEKCLINEQVLKENFLIDIYANNQQIYHYNGDETKCLLGEKNNKYPRCKITTITKNSQTIKIVAGSEQIAKKELG